MANVSVVCRQGLEILKKALVGVVIADQVGFYCFACYYPMVMGHTFPSNVASLTALFLQFVVVLVKAFLA